MDRANCMQNSSFVTDAVKPLEPGMEMSTMVETLAVPGPCVEQGDVDLSCENAESQAPSEEDFQDTLKVPSVSKGGPLPDGDLRVETQIAIPTSRGRSSSPSPLPSTVVLEYSSTHLPASGLVATTETYVFASTLTISELTYPVPQDLEDTYLNPDIPLSHSEVLHEECKLATTYHDDVFSNGHASSLFTPLKSYVTITPSSSAIVFNFDEYVNFSPDAKGSPVRGKMSITRSMSMSKVWVSPMARFKEDRAGVSAEEMEAGTAKIRGDVAVILTS
ncbi:hypothetical protein BC629DRAFT_690266 [Irpex lacteus]|nr:hypothetical protein BC629DRAFT_690266 [Irpex lacteus]